MAKAVDRSRRLPRRSETEGDGKILLALTFTRIHNDGAQLTTYH